MADLILTPANVRASTQAQTKSGVFGATLTQGTVVYEDTAATNKFKSSDSNGTPPANTVAGISLNAGADNQPGLIVVSDPALNIGVVVTSGAVVYLSSDTPGKMTEAYADIDSGSTVIILGVGNSDGTLKFQPVVGGIKA